MDSKYNLRDPTGSLSVSSCQAKKPTLSFDSFDALMEGAVVPDSKSSVSDPGIYAPEGVAPPRLNVGRAKSTTPKAKAKIPRIPGTRKTTASERKISPSPADRISIDRLFSPFEAPSDPATLQSDPNMFAREDVVPAGPRKQLKRKMQKTKTPKIKKPIKKPQRAKNATNGTIGELKKRALRKTMIKEAMALQQEPRHEETSNLEFSRPQILESRTAQGDPDRELPLPVFRVEDQFSRPLVPQKEIQAMLSRHSMKTDLETCGQAEFKQVEQESDVKSTSMQEFFTYLDIDERRHDQSVTPMTRPKVKLNKRIKCSVQAKKPRAKPKKPKMAKKRKAALTIKKKAPIRKVKAAMRRSMEAVAATQRGRTWLSRWLWPSSTRTNSSHN